ncbi:hypothetical protein SARC_03045 [Sphaeroforma arctica JP610]|uniref:Uncharacterized protein n=1 Tax=Sphaeroforma arctica JP610 TaxID=667725 RepID=A0A0L0G761_9EUKA|nr:hypothetical protein SARC_03045 [Sphaeroforma arctica JP610]KNC84754.1 hypothetical protein SARC_03045 [Sphaeroforma arctica JP610]|eukprot:XP_014158656.1 hypothetical protein SARC_03045 [Sphaeroforma arctica JP610]
MYIASGTGFIPGETPGEYRMKHGGGAKNCAIVSSEPLTDDNADWMPIPRNYVVLITEDINVLMAPIVIQGLDTWVCKEKHKISADLSRCLERLNNRSNYGKGESLSQVVSQNVTSLIADSAQRQLISRMEKQEASNVHSGNSKHSLDEINTNFISMKSLSTGLGRAGSMTTLDQRHKASR